VESGDEDSEDRP
jgi:hypothetical protein